MSESLVLTALAGMLGLLLGVGVLVVVSQVVAASSGDMPFRDPQISFGIAVAALVVVIVAGVLAGWLPAKRALQIKAIDALRDE